MNNKLMFRNNQNNQTNLRAADKAIALLDLKETLISEEYERCPRLIREAKRVGTTEAEVHKLLEEAAEGFKEVGPEVEGGRLRF